MMRGSRPAVHFELAEAHGRQLLETLTVRVSRAVQLSGLSRSRIYELIQSGDLETHKVGRTTLIPYRSLKHLVTGLD